MHDAADHTAVVDAIFAAHVRRQKLPAVSATIARHQAKQIGRLPSSRSEIKHSKRISNRFNQQRIFWVRTLDMARFMMAHLGNGEFRGRRILESETAMLMHAEAFQPDPTMPGMALGFWHLDRSGHVIVAHTGDTVVFQAVGLYLIPRRAYGTVCFRKYRRRRRVSAP